MRPTDVTLLFIIPNGTEIKAIQYKEITVKAVQQRV
jgi:hypothetical protein